MISRLYQLRPRATLNPFSSFLKSDRTPDSAFFRDGIHLQAIERISAFEWPICYAESIWADQLIYFSGVAADVADLQSNAHS